MDGLTHDIRQLTGI